MALQKLVWTSAVHAIGMAKGGCRLNLLDTQLILSGVNFALMLHGLASVKRLRVRLKGSVQQYLGTIQRLLRSRGLVRWEQIVDALLLRRRLVSRHRRCFKLSA